uniref:Uncharacterized protein n=1 Tax=Leersia perrieri TaxID=77586 RepID=A0A0D9WZM0_9ORYZ
MAPAAPDPGGRRAERAAVGGVGAGNWEAVGALHLQIWPSFFSTSRSNHSFYPVPASNGERKASNGEGGRKMEPTMTTVAAPSLGKFLDAVRPGAGASLVGIWREDGVPDSVTPGFALRQVTERTPTKYLCENGIVTELQCCPLPIT